MAKKTSKKAASRGSSGGGDIRSRLRDKQREYAKAVARQRGQALPPGTYEGQITNFEVSESQNGNLRAVWTIIVTGPEEFVERTAFKQSMLETKENFDWFKGDCQAIEIDPPDNLEDVGDVGDEAIGLNIRFGARSDDEFTNYDFIERLEGGNGGGKDQPDEGGSDDEWNVGDRVSATVDGEDFPGKISDIIDDENVEVTFDDGDVLTVSINDVEEE
jgi:hypothetical protein